MALVAMVQVFLAGWQAPAVSLGEVARREAARRKATAPSVRSLTDADVGPVPTRTTIVEPPATAVVDPATATDGKAAGDATTDAVKDEPWWKARMSVARQALDRDRLLITALESRVAALNTDVTNRDDPAQRAELIKQRTLVTAELDRMREQVIADQASITIIEEEARKAGIPPAWIR